MSTHNIRSIINGQEVEREVEARTSLADLLRNELGLVGTKVSCGVQICGSCTVLVDGSPVSSCTYLAVEIDGRTVTTIEGVSERDEPLSVVQSAFVKAGAVQCGYCTPGFVLTVTALFNEYSNPSDREIKHFLDGNICRCTGYEQIIEAVRIIAKSRVTVEQ